MADIRNDQYLHRPGAGRGAITPADPLEVLLYDGSGNPLLVKTPTGETRAALGVAGYGHDGTSWRPVKVNASGQAEVTLSGSSVPNTQPIPIHALRYYEIEVLKNAVSVPPGGTTSGTANLGRAPLVLFAVAVDQAPWGITASPRTWSAGTTAGVFRPSGGRDRTYPDFAPVVLFPVMEVFPQGLDDASMFKSLADYVLWRYPSETLNYTFTNQSANTCTVTIRLLRGYGVY